MSLPPGSLGQPAGAFGTQPSQRTLFGTAPTTGAQPFGAPLTGTQGAISPFGAATPQTGLFGTGTAPPSFAPTTTTAQPSVLGTQPIQPAFSLGAQPSAFAAQPSQPSTSAPAGLFGTTPARPAFSISPQPVSTQPLTTPVSQPTNPAQLFTPTASAPSATSAPTVQPAQPAQPKSQHELNKRIQDLFSDWKAKIESQYQQFKALGERTIEVERQGYESHRELLLLQESVKKAEEAHSSINGQLDMISSEQQDLNQLLDGIEQEVDRALEQSGISGYGNDERDSLYHRAKTVRSNIDEVDQIVASIVKVINDRHETSGRGDDVEQTVNTYLETLNWIESSALLLGGRLKSLEKTYKNRRPQL